MARALSRRSSGGTLSNPPWYPVQGYPSRIKLGVPKISRTKNPEGQGFAIALLAKASDYFVFPPEITMPKVSLSGMTVEALMDLRKRVDEMLHERRAELEQQLRAFAVVGGARVVRGGGSVLKGRKVPPKYRSPSGDTWAGRGARPRWLVAAIKGGKKLDDFIIDKSARKRKRRSKR